MSPMDTTAHYFIYLWRNGQAEMLEQVMTFICSYFLPSFSFIIFCLHLCAKINLYKLI